MGAIAVLVALEGPRKDQRFVITNDGLCIGRQDGLEISIEDPGLSRQHARVLLHNGAVWVQDIGSRNGVFVNDTRIGRHQQLNVGDQVRLGGSAFQVELESPLPDATSVSSTRTPAHAPNGGFKKWPFVLAGSVIFGLIVLVSIAGFGGPAVEDAPLVGSDVAQLINDAAGYTDEQPEAATDAAATPKGPATIGDLFKTQDESTAEGSGEKSDVPAPPEGATVRSLLEAAEMDENAGKLAKALTSYKQAQVLDASCAKCQSRISRISSEIQERIRENLSDAQEYYGSFQFREAIGSWETVLQYIDDPDDPMRKQVEEQLEIARKQLQSQY
jgi:pSer/pThr/pTyr-binding forkhead associated (FHA) protein